MAVALLVVSARAFCAVGQGALSEVPDLSGCWVMVQVMPALTSLPLVGAVELTTITGTVVEVEQDGTELVLRDTVCFTDVEMSPPVATSQVPAGFIASLDPAPRRARLEARGAGWTLVQPYQVDVRGAMLAVPESESLPTDADDPRVWDQDGDGHPGLTVAVQVAGIVTGKTYVVERLGYDLCGEWVDPNTILGTMTWTSEQIVLAASNVLLCMSYSYAPHPDPTRSSFVMRRMDPAWTCETIRALLPDLVRLASLPLATAND